MTDQEINANKALINNENFKSTILMGLGIVLILVYTFLKFSEKSRS